MNIRTTVLLITTLTLLPAAAARSQDSTTVDLTGTWLVMPAGSISTAPFVFGEMQVFQDGSDIWGTYTLKKDNLSSICSSPTYDVTGHIAGNRVTLRAIGEKSQLNGIATIVDGQLRGTGMEVYKSQGCTGYVKSDFTIKRADTE